MKLLLDTHIAIWTIEDNAQLSGKARWLINDIGNDIFCSAVSAWEVAIKHAVHPERMFIDGAGFISYCEKSGFAELPVSERHVKALETLRRPASEPNHNDPFDRMLISQAKADNMLLITHDRLIAAYEEDCILFV